MQLRNTLIALLASVYCFAGCAPSAWLRTQAPAPPQFTVAEHPTVYVALTLPPGADPNSARWLAFTHREEELLANVGVTMRLERDAAGETLLPGELVIRTVVSPPSDATLSSSCSWLPSVAWLTGGLLMLGCIGSEDGHWNDAMMHVRIFNATGAVIHSASVDDELTSQIDTGDRAPIVRGDYEVGVETGSPTFGGSPSQGPAYYDLEEQIGRRSAEQLVAHLLPDLQRAEDIVHRRMHEADYESLSVDPIATLPPTAPGHT